MPLTTTHQCIAEISIERFALRYMCHRFYLRSSSICLLAAQKVWNGVIGFFESLLFFKYSRKFNNFGIIGKPRLRVILKWKML